MITGSSTRLVRITTRTPTLAAMARSRITSIWITIRVAKPMPSEISAVRPGTYRERKAKRAAPSELLPWAVPCRIALIICTPWLTPMANTRNGISIE